MKHPYKFLSYKLLSRLIIAQMRYSQGRAIRGDRFEAIGLFEKRPLVPLIKSRRNGNVEQTVQFF